MHVITAMPRARRACFRLCSSCGVISDLHVAASTAGVVSSPGALSRTGERTGVTTRPWEASRETAMSEVVARGWESSNMARNRSYVRTSLVSVVEAAAGLRHSRCPVYRVNGADTALRSGRAGERGEGGGGLGACLEGGVGNGGGGGGRNEGGFRLRSLSRVSADKLSASCAAGSYVSSSGALDGLHARPAFRNPTRETDNEGAQKAVAGGCTHENSWVGDTN